MSPSPSSIIVRGSIDALPLFIPAIPFAFVFGVVVANAGIPGWLGWSSSPIIFGGAIQVTLFTLLGEGASVAAATVKLRTLRGVERAGIASAIPNEYGICQLLDAGANPEAKPEHLVTYAVMGAVYSHYVLGVKRPKIGIMSNGEEDEKGTKFTKETFALIKELESSGKAPFEFVGNVEGHDLFESDLNVVLCDGFTGNIILKSCEATAKAMSKWLKVEFKRNPIRILGAIIAKGAFKAVKKKSSYEYVGGSPLLGVNGVCIIGHGGSSALAIENAVRVARETVKLEVNPHIEEMIDKIH